MTAHLRASSLMAALCIMDEKAAALGSSLVEVLLRTAHTNFGLQPDDLRPTADEIEAVQAAAFVPRDVSNYGFAAEEVPVAPFTFEEYNANFTVKELEAEAAARTPPVDLSAANVKADIIAALVADDERIASERPL